MTSFFGRLKSHTGPLSPPVTPAPQKPAAAATASPLDQLLANAGPIRDDGSDKFFGMHNPSNTCYCNSVVQCLYFSEPFREQVINFPSRLPRDIATRSYPSTTLSPEAAAEAAAPPLSYPAAKPIVEPHVSMSPRKVPLPSPAPPTPITNAPENKESFDYMKKQAMIHGPNLRMEHGNYEVYGMPESLFTGLKDIFEAVIAHDSRTGIVTPAKFLDILRKNFELFRSPMHQDAHEFLNLLLNEVVDQVESFSKKNAALPPANGSLNAAMAAVVPQGTSPNSTSWVHELFEGTLTSETRCLTCETISRRDEVFLDLSVDLEEHSSVTSCLSKFSQEEMLCERNKFHCDKCGGLQEAEKRMKIKRLPRILALHLKRFKYIEEVGRLQKLFHRVVFPFHLRLLNTTDDAEDPDRLYELYAIVVHLGSTPFHGHYVSIIKTKDKGWLLFDDELVLPVDKDYIRNYFGGDPRNPACAYVLFYQETSPDAMAREQQNEDDLDEKVHDSAMNGSTLLSPGIEKSPALSAQDGPQSPMLEEHDELPGLTPPVAAYPTSSLNSRHEVRRTLPPLTTQDVPSSERRPRPISAIDPSSYRSPKLDSPVGEDTSTAKDNPGGFGTFKTGGLSRFRTTSLSKRPKFWGSRDSKADVMDGYDEEGEGTSSLLDKAPASPSADKSRSGRFGLGLGRKKSNLPSAGR